jgi:hypothetical protein
VSSGRESSDENEDNDIEEEGHLTKYAAHHHHRSMSLLAKVCLYHSLNSSFTEACIALPRVGQRLK